EYPHENLPGDEFSLSVSRQGSGILSQNLSEYDKARFCNFYLPFPARTYLPRRYLPAPAYFHCPLPPDNKTLPLPFHKETGTDSFLYIPWVSLIKKLLFSSSASPLFSSFYHNHSYPIRQSDILSTNLRQLN